MRSRFCRPVRPTPYEISGPYFIRLQREDRLAKLKSEISTKEMELKARPSEYE
jgi:hypothetical protein